MDGTSDDYFFESVRIDEVISAARTYMQDNNIYNLPTKTQDYPLFHSQPILLASANVVMLIQS